MKMDTDKINFNELWSRQKAEQPALKDLLLKMNNFKKSGRKRIIVTNVLFLLTSIFILCIWYFYQPQLLTTKIGITLIILAMAVFAISSTNTSGLLKKTNEAESTQKFLTNLVAIKEKQQFIQTTMLNIYFVLLSAGIALYMAEYTSRMTTFQAVFAYGITALWILFNWFYIRPKQTKKQQSKLNEIIRKFEDIQTQLNQE